MEHLMKVAAAIRKSPQVYDEVIKEGYTTHYNAFDYL
jgi:hypothetical protein